MSKIFKKKLKQYFSFFEEHCQSEDIFLENIVCFINNSGNSYLNKEDVKICDTLIFHSKFKSIHIHFYYWFYNKYIKKNPDWTIRTLTRYGNYLHAISPYYLQDLCWFLLKTKNTDLINLSFKCFKPEHKLLMAKISAKMPNLYEKLNRAQILNFLNN